MKYSIIKLIGKYSMVITGLLLVETRSFSTVVTEGAVNVGYEDNHDYPSIFPVLNNNNDLAPSEIQFREIVAGLNYPIFLTHAGDGSGRLFILEKSGLIRILINGQVLPTPFLDIQTIVNSTGGEQGLLGIAFHPDYASNGYYFTSYTSLTGSLILSRFNVSGSNTDWSDPASQAVLLEVNHPTFLNHNGGSLAFGSDGYLYWSTGDGGGGDADNNAQSLNSLLGKIIRIDVDSGFPYEIPSSNPFFNDPDPLIKEEIWSYGLRNPWRFSFDRLTGGIFIADVGENNWEEINWRPSTSTGGENYGWKVFEGNHCNSPAVNCTPPNGYVAPVFEYSHDDMECSVTGGYVYRGSKYPQLDGLYFFGDFCSGRLFSLYQSSPSVWTDNVVRDTPYWISSFGEDQDSELYLIDYLGGKIYQMQYLAREPLTDFDGNGTTDVSVFRPSNGVWYILNGTSVQYGGAGDIPVPGDYDGNGSTDIAVFRPSNGVWYILNGTSVQYGGAGDIPVPGDYDGNGTTDIAVFRPSNGVWYILGGTSVQYGGAGDIPVPGDYDGNGTTDIAVFRPSNGVWFIHNQTATQYGGVSDIPVPGDYDGDGFTDIAVFRPSNGVWYVYGMPGVQYGGNVDIPVPGDYNENGITDIAVFRPSNGVWYVSGMPGVQYGVNGDVPLPALISYR